MKMSHKLVSRYSLKKSPKIANKFETKTNVLKAI